MNNTHDSMQGEFGGDVDFAPQKNAVIAGLKEKGIVITPKAVYEVSEFVEDAASSIMTTEEIIEEVACILAD
jgi:hypothetical protein